MLTDPDDVTKTAWAKRFGDEGKRLGASGYDWFSRQTLQLAAALGADSSCGTPTPRASEVFLVHLFEREPEWRRALRAIDEFATTEEQNQSTLAHRVAWFVDMNTGELVKPMLEEYRAGVGWTRRGRVDLEYLRERCDRLPPEDVAVLRAHDATAPRSRVQVHAMEALCGHPRVFNGSRGRLPVEVVRGSGRVETRTERGMLVISVVPENATEGLNVVVESETRLTVYRISSSLARLMHSLGGEVRVPETHREEALVALARMAEHVEIRSAELGATRTVRADSTPSIRITPEVGAFWVEVGVRPFGEHGRFFPPGMGQGVISVHGQAELIDAERDFASEESRFCSLAAACPTLRASTHPSSESDAVSNEPSFGFSLGEEELFALLAELRDCALPCQIEWKNGKALRYRGAIHGGSLSGALRRIKGWYILDGRVPIDEVTSFDLSELVRMPYTRTGRFLRLPSGDFVEVERRVQRVLSQLARVAALPARGASGPLKIPDAVFEPMVELLEAATALDVEATAMAWRQRIQDTLSSEPKVPSALLANLRPYQLEGYQWLFKNAQLGFGVCLADDMGLGKTLQVIALLIARAAEGPALVVAPTSVCGNWLAELARFAPSLVAVEYAGKSRSSLLEPLSEAGKGSGVVVVTSYALLQQDVAELTCVDWNTTVLDEAQFIKNPHALRAKAAFRLSSRFRIAMSGTPIENHLGDLWSVFHYVNPALLGSLKHFQLTYLKPIEREGESESIAELKRLVRPFLLRRRKDEVLADLPSLTVLSHLVPMSDDESRRYALLRQQVHERLRTSYGRREHKLEVLAEITRLRRFCCHPRLVFPDAPLEATRIQAFLELADELREMGIARSSSAST
ncbi:MAG: SNF2-related protein [Polyangiaceae bacterium]